jgi:hypothetical protein
MSGGVTISYCNFCRGSSGLVHMAVLSRTLILTSLVPILALCSTSRGKVKHIYERYTIAKVPHVLKIKWGIITTLNVAIYSSTEVSLFFNIISEHIDAFVPSLHGDKNCVAVEVGLLHSQPFTSSHLHVLIVVESATSQVLVQRPKQMEVWRGKFRTIRTRGL